MIFASFHQGKEENTFVLSLRFYKTLNDLLLTLTVVLSIIFIA